MAYKCYQMSVQHKLFRVCLYIIQLASILFKLQAIILIRHGVITKRKYNCKTLVIWMQ